MENIKDRFLRYVAVDTQSDETSDSQPSARKELILLEMLRDELRAMGVDAELDQWGYVMASIPSNIGAKVPAIGFIAHVDTSPDASGKDIKPQIIENYDGSDIPLRGVPGMSLKTAEFPEILRHIGETVITTDGTTLLGADDKAGVAEIMTAVERLLTDNTAHGKVCIGFTPDEEVGHGADRFDIPAFGAEYAYTVDGGDVGGIEYENFNASSATVEIHGFSVHPGDSKDKMINALNVAMEFHAALPAMERPEHTEGREGFYHLCHLNGNITEAKLEYILRDHDADKQQNKKDYLLLVAKRLNDKYGEGTVTVTLEDQYRNMVEQILPHFHLVETAQEAIRRTGLEPVAVPVRGGTDGARLSWMGLPCPNLGTGGFNFHGTAECTTVERMDKATEILLHIVELFAAK